MQEGADDLEILIPAEKTITIKGESVTFKDYDFYAGLKIRALAKELINELASLFNDPQSITLSETDALLGRHADAVVSCIALACDKSEAWVFSLNEAEGELAHNAWQEVNLPFFVRCASRNMRSQKMEKLVVGLMFGQSSQGTIMMQKESGTTHTDK